MRLPSSSSFIILNDDIIVNGLGGHCIPIDPFYLSWKARQNGFERRFIELAGHVNASMPEYVVQRVADALNTARKPINGSRIHLVGIA